jgi:hypothetical protein
MRRFLPFLILILVALPFCATWDALDTEAQEDRRRYFGRLKAGEALMVPKATDCSTLTSAEGDLCYDTDDEILYVYGDADGDGTNSWQTASTGTGAEFIDSDNDGTKDTSISYNVTGDVTGDLTGLADRADCLDDDDDGTCDTAHDLDRDGTTDLSGDGSSNLTVQDTFTINGLANCDTIDTDASGVLSCGTDDAGSGSPGGSDTQVQYNSSGSFAGDSGLTYDGSGNLTMTGDLTAQGQDLHLDADGTADLSSDGSGNLTAGADFSVTGENFSLGGSDISGDGTSIGFDADSNSTSNIVINADSEIVWPRGLSQSMSLYVGDCGGNACMVFDTDNDGTEDVGTDYCLSPSTFLGGSDCDGDGTQDS